MMNETSEGQVLAPLGTSNGGLTTEVRGSIKRAIIQVFRRELD
ncbi:unnamed protein product, partial [Amoebophrya sp. A25]|eukprot:GSA25T00006623001.1